MGFLFSILKSLHSPLYYKRSSLTFPGSSAVLACRQAGSGAPKMKKYFVYAIQSQIDKRIYVGLSSNPEKRLASHNKGDTKSTKPYRPWVIFYIKEASSRVEARLEEKKLKQGAGKEFLKNEACRRSHKHSPVAPRRWRGRQRFISNNRNRLTNIPR